MKNKFWTLLAAFVLALSLCSACGKPLGYQPSPLPGGSITHPGEDDGDDDLPDDPPDPEESEPPTAPDPEPPADVPPPVVEKPEEVPPPAVKPVVKKDILVCSNTDSLTVRAGKGTSYTALGTLDKGDMAAYVATSGNWHQIIYKRQTAYVSASYAYKVEFEKGSEAIEAVIEQGKKLLGLPYVFGAQRYHWGNGVRNPSFDGKSFDCSSLTQYVYKMGAGVNLATTSREQSLQGKAVSELKRGDLMFFTNESRKNNTGIERIGHVGIYFGDNMILHTASDHAVIEPISSKRWSFYITARRVV